MPRVFGEGGRLRRFRRRAPLTLDAWFDEWLAHMEVARPRTAPCYRQRLAHVRSLGALHLDQLTARDIRKILASVSGDTMRHHVYGALSTCLRAAVREGYIERSPCSGITAPRKGYFEARTLTTQQAQRLVDVAWDTRMGPLLTLALSTGMRSGELFALTWDDVDLESGQLTVSKSVRWQRGGNHVAGPPKTRSGRRTVWIDGPAVRALTLQRQRVARMRLHAESWPDLSLVFPAVDGGYWIPRGRFVTHYRALLSRADCPQIRFHDLRHTAGLFLTRSVGIVVASRMLGHSNPGITSTLYGHAQLEDFSSAARAMGDLLTIPR